MSVNRFGIIDVDDVQLCQNSVKQTFYDLIVQVLSMEHNF